MHRPAPRFLAASLAVLAAASVPACGGSGASTGTLQVRMQDTPVDEADNVFVTVASVEVFRRDGDGEEVRETLVDAPAQYDLLVLRNGVEAVLGTGEFPLGDYTAIRLIVAPDSPSDVRTLPADRLNNYVVIDGVAYPLIVPSGAQTGIKLNHPFTLSSDVITVLTLDFDVRRSVHQRGHQMVFNLRPTIRVVDTVVSGTVSGTVTTADASAIPAGTVVSAQQGGVEVASGAVDPATGTYRIGPLLAGTYDLVAIAPGYEFASEAGVVVTAQQDSAGHDVTLVPAAGAGDAVGTVTHATAAADAVVVRLLWNGFQVAVAGIDPVTGAYGFLGVPAGTYTVEAGDGANTASGAAVVTAGGSTTTDLSLP